MTWTCQYCSHPLDQHVKDPHSLGCPQPQYRFSFQIGDELIHATTASIGLARQIARSLATSHGATIRIFKHGKRIPFSWEEAA
jgi:hypothetical protein